MIQPPPVSLEKPGAGLPVLELLFARHLMMPFLSRTRSWDESYRRFLGSGEKILEYTSDLNKGKMERQVLIPRLPGLEDSSRFWSVAMTLEHLTIAGNTTSGIIVELSHDRIPPLRLEITQVKPFANDANESRRAFQAMLKTASTRLLREVKNRSSKARLRHPWFGPITAREWNCLIAFHQDLHFRQIRQIIKRL